MPSAGAPIRYRVTGALFLLALAAIFAPMVFDGAGLKGADLAPMPRPKPAQPVVAPEGAFAGLDAIAEQAAVLRGAVDEQQFGSATQSQVRPEPTESIATGHQRPAEPGLAALTPQTEVWAVQVASFSNRDNAVALRGQLRKQGFEAFLSEIKRRSEVLTRVAVGPYLSEADASRALRTISERFNLDAQLVAMVI